MRSIFLLIAIFLLVVPFAEAQTGPILPRPGSNPNSVESAPGSIRGRVVLPDGALASEAFRITLLVMRGTQASSYTDQQGQFEFRGLTPGEYSIEVEGDPHRFELTRETVQVYRGTPSLVTVTLREKSGPAARDRKSPAVSVAEIKQDVPAKARGEFERASKAAREGKRDDAVLHLRKAIEIYPNFLMARNDLGALLLESGNLEQAEQELRRTLEFDAKAFNPMVNLGIVLVKKHEFPEAVQVLERGTSLNGASPLVRLYLGMALAGIENFDRAEAELKTAYDLGGREYALALFNLGQIYLQQGQRSAALKSFELFLKESPSGENSTEARKLIGMLK
jgi:Flp pilus assembly protein TadD